MPSLQDWRLLGLRTQDCAGSRFARRLHPGLFLRGPPFQGSGKRQPSRRTADCPRLDGLRSRRSRSGSPEGTILPEVAQDGAASEQRASAVLGSRPNHHQVLKGRPSDPLFRFKGETNPDAAPASPQSCRSFQKSPGKRSCIVRKKSSCQFSMGMAPTPRRLRCELIRPVGSASGVRIQ